MTEALTDPLTHIFNRRAWDQFISSEEVRCKKYGSPASVLIIDINDLKKINDQLGHSFGDDLLKKIAFTLKACVRANDVVARLGGDEFGILLIETNEDDSIAFLNRIKHTLRRNKIDAAIGLAIRHPLEGFLSAINEADLQMYSNKKHKKLQLLAI